MYMCKSLHFISLDANNKKKMNYKMLLIRLV